MRLSAITVIMTLLPMSVAIADDAQSQNQASSNQEHTNQPATLEEIVVTAQRRETKLQDTPLAVTALPAERLAQAHVEDTAQLQTSVPSLQYTFQPGSSFIYLRGVGNNIFGTYSDNSVATYIDGVYIPRPTSAVQELYDVNRVEVLRGPQATLYGRNATGGAILITTEEPTDEFTGSADAQLGNFGSQRYRGTISGPIVDDKL